MLKSHARQPRAVVLVNDIRVAYHSIEVNSNAYYQADTFRVTLPVHGQPSGIDRAWWGAQDAYEVQVYIGFPSNPDSYTAADLGEPLIIGRADSNPDSMIKNTITLSGRDLTSLLIDSKTTMKWPNHTSSDIVRILAAEVGLKCEVFPTKRKVGVFYKHDHARMQIEMTKWDLLVWLARAEKFQVFIKGDTLMFGPDPGGPLPSYVVEIQTDSDGIAHFDGADLVFERNMTLAKDIIVYVKSWKLGGDKKPYVKEARATHTRDKVLKRTNYNIGKPQVIERTIPGLTPEQALQKAQQILAEISRHQVKMEAVGMPGDNTLTPRHLIQVVGAGAYDQTYHPDSIIRRYSPAEDGEGGYTMSIIAKNHDVNSQVVL